MPKPANEQSADRNDAILEGELARLASSAAAIGATAGATVDGAGSPGTIAAQRGADRGARWAAKRLKNKSFEHVLTSADSPEGLLDRVGQALGQLGTPQADGVPGDALRIRAVIGSGFARMNPTVVEAISRPSGDGGTILTISATAKEGLINQHSAEKAVRAVLAALEPGSETIR